MKRAFVVTLALVVIPFLPSSAAAIALSNVAITDAQFEARFNGPATLGVAGSAFGGGASGTVYSAVFAGDPLFGVGEFTGFFVYTYMITVDALSAGSVSQISIAFGSASNIVTTLDLGNTALADSSFFMDFALGGGGTLDTFYPPHGTVAPSSSEVDAGTGVYRTNFSISAGSTSRIFGVVSSLPPGTVLATLIDGAAITAPTVVSPVPEPATLLLLGSGLSGLAAWGWRRRKVS